MLCNVPFVAAVCVFAIDLLNFVSPFCHLYSFNNLFVVFFRSFFFLFCLFCFNPFFVTMKR